MKKSRVKIVLTSLFLMGFLTIGYFASRSMANTPINPDCPNGCKPCGQYCYCNGDHPNLAEAKWKPVEIKKQ
ncbi:MAG: hypothetical protein KBA42_06405 [Bacteroidales bacterium]|nr:hypothetical protein [Bacteroidales bacterium]MBP9028562.1 hypothetical protein [Bacteroidales bacterium]HRR11039.1 hypothetical protein [Tenuifilum sp.]